jgi:hypothetical protein
MLAYWGFFMILIVSEKLPKANSPKKNLKNLFMLMGTLPSPESPRNPHRHSAGCLMPSGFLPENRYL